MSSLLEMDWGPEAEATKRAFLQRWKNDIKANGDGKLLAAAGDNVFKYLFNAVTDVVNSKSWKGMYSGPGTQWAGAATTDVIAAALWSDGSRGCQESPLDSGPGCQWWPCVVLNSELALVPFYCPGLAYPRARPKWGAHRTRLWFVAWLAPHLVEATPLSPQVAPPPVAPQNFNTSTVTIEEVIEPPESEDEASTLSEWDLVD